MAIGCLRTVSRNKALFILSHSACGKKLDEGKQAREQKTLALGLDP